jgi:3-hydroxyisobutyrate dehydrogenase-like beta-hydroxyacid dehydrogenase
MDIGFIGIGRMGRPITQRLLAAGHSVSVFDVDPNATTAVRAAGARGCDDPAAVAERCGLVFTCVPGPKEVDDVIRGPRGLLSSAAPDSIIVELSVIGPALGRMFAERAAGVGVHFLDAPLSGGEAGAAKGDLTAMVGGDKAILERARPFLGVFCAAIFHLGGSGSGYIAKAINQMIYLSYVASFSEAAALGDRAGLDMPVLLDVLKSSVAGNPLVTGWDARLRVVKDLEAGEEACATFAFKADIFATVMESFRNLAAGGHAAADMTALFRTKR